MEFHFGSYMLGAVTTCVINIVLNLLILCRCKCRCKGWYVYVCPRDKLTDILLVGDVYLVGTKIAPRWGT